MRSVVVTGVCLAALSLVAVIDGGAQEHPASSKADEGAHASTTDPRYTLKPGLHDAGEAAKNMERIASLPKPDGFFDPAKPAVIRAWRQRAVWSKPSSRRMARNPRS